jgi:hypothetical protein
MASATSLNKAQHEEAFRRIARWRAGDLRDPACPLCEAPGLTITDRSARPHAEWYHLKCGACGLDTTLGMPLGSVPPSLD